MVTDVKKVLPKKAHKNRTSAKLAAHSDVLSISGSPLEPVIRKREAVSRSDAVRAPQITHDSTEEALNLNSNALQAISEQLQAEQNLIKFIGPQSQPPAKDTGDSQVAVLEESVFVEILREIQEERKTGAQETWSSTRLDKFLTKW